MNPNPSKDDRTRRSHPHHVRSQGPVPAASVHVENDNYQGQILPETEKIAREQKAQDGVPALRNLKLGKGAGGFGAELEMVFIDKQSFRSAPVAREVLKHYEESGCDDATATPEFGLHDGELNLRPILERDPNCLDIMARRLNSSGRQLVKSAAASGALVLPVGIPPGLMAADLNQGLITPNPRFYDLDRSLMHQWEQAWKSGKKEEVDYLVDTDRGGFRVRLAEKEFTVAGPEGVINLDISNKVRYALFNTSFQVHFGVEDQSRYAEYHAYAELLVPIMVGLCANSPEAAGVMTGVLCQRGLFTAVALDPDRVFLEKSWLRDPLQ